MEKEFLKIGHRGARAYEPENTIRSFKRALELGVNAVEFDVRQTKDKKVIVIHDEDVKRTTNGEGFVRDMTLKQIKEFDAGRGEKVPSFEEVLDFIGKKAMMFIELKETGFEDRVL